MKIRSLATALLFSFFIAASAQPPVNNDSIKPGKTAGASKERLVSFLTGDSTDVTTKPVPGLLLAGGSTDLDSAVKWFLDRSNGGDIVVLRATESDGYNQYMFDLSKVNSVETLVIDTFSKAWLPEVALKIRNAEGLFISGGDQWNYVRYWKNTPVEDAINYLLNTKKVPVGGTSAGLAVLGGAYFSAQNGTVTSSQALANPYDSLNSIGYGDFLNAPFMKNIITDSHYTQRERHGRQIAWMARLIKDAGLKKIKGIGIDEKTALCIDQNGQGVVIGTNSVYFLSSESSQPEQCAPGKPLTWDTNSKPIMVYRIQGTNTGNGHYDSKSWKFSGGNSFSYTVKNGVLSMVK